MVTARKQCGEGFLLGGLVAGEGSFSTSNLRRPYADGSPRRRFVFLVELARRDRALLERLQAFVGVGAISDRPSRRTGWQPTSTFGVRSHDALRRAVIPFAEHYLLPSAKRRQFERWRDGLAAQEAAHPSRFRQGRSRCSVEGCDGTVRGRGLCRRHYYRATGW